MFFRTHMDAFPLASWTVNRVGKLHHFDEPLKTVPSACLTENDSPVHRNSATATCCPDSSCTATELPPMRTKRYEATSARDILPPFT